MKKIMFGLFVLISFSAFAQKLGTEINCNVVPNYYKNARVTLEEKTINIFVNDFSRDGNQYVIYPNLSEKGLEVFFTVDLSEDIKTGKSSVSLWSKVTDIKSKLVLQETQFDVLTGDDDSYAQLPKNFSLCFSLKNIYSKDTKLSIKNLDINLVCAIKK